MDYKAFRKHLKNGELERVYLFYGPERYMLQHCEKLLIQKALGGGDPAWNISRFGEKADAHAVRNACEMLPMFSPRRIVRVEKCPAFHKAENSGTWADIVKNMPDTTLLLFVQTNKPDGRLALTKAVTPARQVLFEPLSEKDLQQIIAESVKQRGLMFHKDALQQLIYQAGTDAGTLAQETHKLENFIYPKKEITVDDVHAAAIRNEQADAFDITNDFIAGKHENAFSRLALFIRQGGVVPKLRGALVFSLRQLLTARLLLNDNVAKGTIMKRIRGPWLAREKTIKLAGQVSSRWIERALCAVAEGDEMHKSGQTDERSAFELSLLRAFVQNKKSDASASDS